MELSTFLHLSHSIMTPFTLRCAAELKISDHIHAYDGQAIPLKELARAIPIAPEKEPMLGQVMRLLVQQGVFAQSEEGYMLTPVSELMLSKGSGMGAYIYFQTDPKIVHTMSIMANWFKSSGVGTIHQMKFQGKSVWESTKENPDLGNLLNEAMASRSRKSMKDVVASCPQLFEGLKSIVDVGGGTGTCVKVIADTFPELRCTVFDLPQVISNQMKSDLFDAMEGSMFEKIPAADAVMLKQVLHNWSDDDCIKILERCREAIAPNSRRNVGCVLGWVCKMRCHAAYNPRFHLRQLRVVLFLEFLAEPRNSLFIGGFGARSSLGFFCSENILESPLDPYTPYPTRVLRILERLSQRVILPRDSLDTQSDLVLHLQLLIKKLNTTED